MGSGSKSVGGAVPPETRKMVQSIKEIVSNFPENEIYAVLKDCNMDPDAAVQRLLSLDTFHEVKSKRERRKETKETQDTRSRGNHTGSSHGVKGANDHNLRRNATALAIPNDYGNGTYKRENGTVSPTLYSSSSASHTAGKTLTQQPSSHGYSFGADDGRHSTGTVDAMSSSVQQHQQVQSAWSGSTPGLVSMADVVKMGRSHNKASLQSTDTSHSSNYSAKAHHISAPSRPDPCFPNPPRSINESGNDTDKHIHHDEWPAIEQPATTTGSSALDVSAVHDADIYLNQSNLYGDGGNMSRNCPSQGVVSNGGVAREFTKNASAQSLMNGPATSSHYNNSTIKDINFQNELLEGNGLDIPFQSRSDPKAGDNIITVSSAAEELEHLSLGKEDHVKSSTGDNCTVVFPNNFQALAGDCSFLSFGTYKSSNGTALSGPPTLDLQKPNMEEASSIMDGPLDTRYFGYGADGLTESYNSHKATADAGIYDLPVSTQPELMKETISEATYGHEYMSPLSVPDSSFENIPQSSALPFSNADRTIGNLPSSNEVLGYSNPRQVDLLASTVESLRGSDDLQLAYLASQLLPSRYSAAMPSIGNPPTSIAEVAKASTFLPQQPPQTLPGAVGQGLQQHLTAHQYPQSSLNVEQLAKLIGYQSQHNTYAQESYQGGSSYQSLADMKYLPQQYNGASSLNNLPVTNANASGYASFGNSTNIPGGFMHNPSVAPSATNRDSYDLFLSQYKDANHFNPTLRQNDGSTWDYNTGSRTMPSVPSNAYYSQAHNQQHLGYRQNPQASQHYSAPGYLDSHHSQTAMPQSLDDATLYSQIPLSKQQQLWQQRY